MGCNKSAGPPVGIVKGQVTFESQPVTKGGVTFVNIASGVALMAEIGPDGRFEMKSYTSPGLPPGSYQVAINSRGMSHGEQPKVQQPGKREASELPSRYSNAAASGLTAEVQVGENPPYHFALTK